MQKYHFQRRWTLEEKQIVKRMVGENKGDKEIASYLGRTAISIKRYRQLNGLIKKRGAKSAEFNGKEPPVTDMAKIKQPKVKQINWSSYY